MNASCVTSVCILKDALGELIKGRVAYKALYNCKLLRHKVIIHFIQLHSDVNNSTLDRTTRCDVIGK